MTDTGVERGGPRAELFRSLLPIASSDRVLDLGSEDGSAFHSLGVQARITIADIDADAVACGAERYGYEPVILPESGKLPFRDGEFEVVYCSSVIEHVTGFNKDETWQVSGPNFEARRAKLSNSSRTKSDVFRGGTLSRPRHAVSRSNPTRGCRSSGGSRIPFRRN